MGYWGLGGRGGNGCAALFFDPRYLRPRLVSSLLPPCQFGPSAFTARAATQSQDKRKKKNVSGRFKNSVSIADVLSGADPRRTSRYGLPSGCAKRQFLRGGQSPLALYGGADKTRGNETISEKTEKKYYFFTFTRHPSPASHNKIKPRYTNKGYHPPSSLSASPLSPSSSLNTP